MSEYKNDLSEKDLERISSLIYIFMWQLQANGRQQHVELINTFSTMIKYLKEEKDYMPTLNKVKYSPILFVLQSKGDLFTEEEIKNFDMNYHLAELDFIYFRDTTFNYRLRKEYRSTHTKKRYFKKKINLSQIITILSFIREWVSREFFYLIKKHDLLIPQISLPQTTAHNLTNVGVPNQIQGTH